MNKFFLIITSFTLLTLGCSKKDDKKSQTVIASCEIENVSLDTLECTEFYSGYSGNSETFCDDAQDRHVASIKNHKDSSSSPVCYKTTDMFAKCTLTNHVLYFYQEGYTSGQAQTECNTLGGEFSEN